MLICNFILKIRSLFWDLKLKTACKSDSNCIKILIRIWVNYFILVGYILEVLIGWNQRLKMKSFNFFKVLNFNS